MLSFKSTAVKIVKNDIFFVKYFLNGDLSLTFELVHDMCEDIVLIFFYIKDSDDSRRSYPQLHLEI